VSNASASEQEVHGALPVEAISRSSTQAMDHVPQALGVLQLLGATSKSTETQAQQVMWKYAGSSLSALT